MPSKKKQKPAKKKKAPAKKAKKKAPAKAKRKAPARKQTPAPKKAPPAKKAPVAKPAKPAKVLPPPSTNAPQAGQPAPDFNLPGNDGQQHSLSAHRGTPVVVYFYPRDDTPGCTTEACGFRDNMARISAKGAVVYGVSKDSLKSHDKFKQKYNLNFTLLSDEQLDAHQKYGAWGEKIMYGKPMVGVIRSTFLVNRDGTIAKAWPRVKVDGHVDAVIEAIEAL